MISLLHPKNLLIWQNKNWIIRNFSNQIGKINLSVDKILGIKRRDQFQKLLLEFEACGEVFEKYKQDMHIKRSKTIDKFIDVQSDEITMDMINLIPQYVIRIPWNTHPIL